MRNIVTTTILALTMLASVCTAQEKTTDASVFSYETGRLAGARPWTDKEFQNNPEC